MKPVGHEAMRAQLALAAAGALHEHELSAVLAHTAECESCRRELDLWRSYANGLRQLPQPAIPADLVRRTQMRVLQDRESALERRHYTLMLGALLVFSWATSFAAWYVARSVVGVSVEVYGINLVGAGPWILFSSILTWVTAGSAAMVLASHRHTRRFQ
jgi:hypothetical protein